MNFKFSIFKDDVTHLLLNYERVKLEIYQPDYANLLIMLIFFILIILTIKKYELNENENKFLSIMHTDQLRGIAIFFVVLGHLWVHVSKIKPQIILSGESVSLFLILSGYGLAISTKNFFISFKEFCIKRIKRVMLPYWLVTIFILFADYLILNRILKFDQLVMTLLGINTKIEVVNLDYVRWFVTYVLLWYLLFYLFFIKFRSRYSSVLLLIVSFIILPLNYYFLKIIWWNQFFSFPLGCLLAIYFDKFIDFYRKHNILLIIFSIIGVCYVLFYKILMSYESIYSIVTETFPYIFLVYFSEWNSLIISFSSLILIGQFLERGFYSNILMYLGKYSYEIFLLHGIFLIKYNPIIRDQSTFLIIFQFLLLFIFVIALSILTYKIQHLIYDKKTT